jgi:cytochrome c-type biogenesis protein CcmH
VVLLLAGAIAAALPAALCGQSASSPTPIAGASTAELGVERGLPAPAGAGLSGAALEEATEALASRLRCPVCQGLSVADSPSESAQAMRAQIQQLLAEGYSPDQIVEYFERSYGEFVRLVPKARGFNLLVFALPAAALAVGATLVVWVLRRRGATQVAEAAAGAGHVADPLAPYRERVRRELDG